MRKIVIWWDYVLNCLDREIEYLLDSCRKATGQSFNPSNRKAQRAYDREKFRERVRGKTASS